MYQFVLVDCFHSKKLTIKSLKMYYGDHIIEDISAAKYKWRKRLYSFSPRTLQNLPLYLLLSINKLNIPYILRASWRGGGVTFPHTQLIQELFIKFHSHIFYF